MALHLEKKTGVLLRTLQKGGAEVSASSCNPLTTDDDISAALSEEMDIHAWANQTNEEYYECLKNVMTSQPQILIDDGCDLIFLAHKKYPEYVKNMMNSDVHLAYTKNFERDEKITSPFVDLFVPYSSVPIVNFALNCPIDYKIDIENNIRKVILRSVAKKLKLPDEIINQTKKAIHFSSGIDKVVNMALKNN